MRRSTCSALCCRRNQAISGKHTKPSRTVSSPVLLMTGCTAHSNSSATKWAVVLHGGAGVIERASMTRELEATYRAALSKALETASKVLRDGGSAVGAAESGIRVMEDDPLFNAGRGAVFSAGGRNELDAAIMDGATLKAGAVQRQLPKGCDFQR